MTAASAAAQGHHVRGTTPYAWPYDGVLDASRLGLLVLDTGPAPLESPVETEVADAIERLCAAVLSVGGLVVEVTTGCALPSHSPRAAASSGLDGFYESGLDTLLRANRVDRLLLCGRWLEIGVHSTMRSANDRGYECLLVADACASAAPQWRRQALSMVRKSGGIFGAVGDSAGVEEALAASPAARAPHQTTHIPDGGPR